MRHSLETWETSIGALLESGVMKQSVGHEYRKIRTIISTGNLFAGSMQVFEDLFAFLQAGADVGGGWKGASFRCSRGIRATSEFVFGSFLDLVFADRFFRRCICEKWSTSNCSMRCEKS